MVNLKNQLAARLLLLLLPLLCTATAAAAAAEAKPSSAAAPPSPSAAAAAAPPRWLSTQGRHMCAHHSSPSSEPAPAAAGQDQPECQRFKLRCASWSGAQEAGYVPSGLWAAHRSEIAAQARAIGLNCIRLPWSLEAVLGPGRPQPEAVAAAAGGAGGGGGGQRPAPQVPPALLAANPDLVGRSPLGVLDAVVEAIGSQGLLVVLDNHSSDAKWCCGINDGNGLFWTSNYTEADWLHGWRIVATHFANASAVVGAGLRNEPRPAITNGSLIAPTWGSGDPETDFARAYERAAAVVLRANPRWLIFAQGLVAGRDLSVARPGRHPLVLRSSWPDGPVVPHQLVYETHEYPFLSTVSDFGNYSAYSAMLDAAWGFLVKENLAPVWVGEFGVEHTAEGVGSPWFQAVLRYLREHNVDWAYWPLDGQQGPSRSLRSEETYGLLDQTWRRPAYAPLVAALRSLG